MDDEFVGMTDYIMESFHDLLAGDLEEVSDFDSSKGSHHRPSRECFMADGPHHEKTPEGHIKSVHGREVTPPLSLNDEVRVDKRVLPNSRLEQLRAWQQEREDARL
jgi:hypothetical protein